MDMLVTLEVSHAPMSWSKAKASLNIPSIVVTLEVSHAPISSLNDEGASVATIFACRSGPLITRAQRLISAQEGSLRHELPYIGCDFLRARADLIDYMKSIGFLFGGASL